MGLPRSTIALVLSVLGLAVAASLPWQGPALPGRLRVAVVPPPAVASLQPALDAVSDYLGTELRRSVVLVPLDEAGFAAARDDFELALLPASLASGWVGSEALGWAKPLGVSGYQSRPWAVWSRERPWQQLEAPVVRLGDPWSWRGGKDLRPWFASEGLDPEAAALVHGDSPWDHGPVLELLREGACDLAIVREGDLRRAFATGRLDRGAWATAAAGPPQPGILLVAAPGFGGSGKERAREAFLNLDHYRYQPGHLRAACALQALARVGVGGFAPLAPLPALRP